MSKKIAPTLTWVLEQRDNGLDDDGQETQRADVAELRALLAVARAARSAVNFWREEYDIEPPTPQDQALDRALSRLDRLSSGTGKRKGGTR